MLSDIIMRGIKDGHICQKLLADPKLTLEKAEEICLAAAKAEEGKGKKEGLTQNQLLKTNYCPRQNPQQTTKHQQHHHQTTHPM